MSNWKLGQYVRVWRNEGYVYGHIETIEEATSCPDKEGDCDICKELAKELEVMLVGDDGQEIYTTVKDLEEGE